VYQGTRWMDEEERWLNRRELREKAWKEIAKLNHRW
jgi:hypothetical protein